jgi:pimeloyl-ACP methyl ester carboxylesterase
MPYITWQDNQDTVNIYYEVIGRGEPVVFHHGNGNSSQNWHDLGYVDALKNGLQLIMIDSRGYGKSSKPHDPESYSLKSRVTDTIKVLDALNIQKAHMLGGSFSAAFAFIFAKYYPERFQSYILATPYFTLLSDPVLTNAMLQGSVAYLAKLEELFGRFDNEGLRQTFLENDGKALWASNTAEWFNYQEYIHFIKAPTLIYAGSEEPTVEELKNLAKKLPKCQLEILPGMDHKTVYWNGAMPAKLINAFVKKCAILKVC